ncbi:MAG TPA: DUF2254 domain-containing protein [Polyangiales bacterium]|nr:DUF2254 domain-containing protein [Polyangiales bacterium]
MGAWLSNKWENLRSSLWFVPAQIVAACALLAIGTLALDDSLAAERSDAIPYLFSGTADAARTMLSTLASSLLTVLSIAFSLTMIALQQASSQFSPRVLRSITSSRVNQIVVGVYAGTFIYCLLILRTIRGEDAPAPYVPELSVTSSVLLALLCIAMLVYFIHHVSLSLQVSEVIQGLHDQLVEQIDVMFPDPLGQEPRVPTLLPEHARERATKIRASRGGFVRRVDDALVGVQAEDTIVWLHAKVGEYVPRGGVLASMSPAREQLAARINEAYVFDSERSYAQDPLFAVRQLVDIGLRAMSPGVNDPTTAEYVLHHLGDALAQLVGRQFPSPHRKHESKGLQLIVDGPDWDSFVSAAFAQLRRSARSDFDVTRCLLQVLTELGEHATCEQRAAALRLEVAEVRGALHEASFSELDRTALASRSDAALEALSPARVLARAALDAREATQGA